MTTETTTIADTTPGGIYELADAKKLLSAASHLGEHLIDLGEPAREPLFGLIGAIGDKIDAASKAIEAK